MVPYLKVSFSAVHNGVHPHGFTQIPYHQYRFIPTFPLDKKHITHIFHVLSNSASCNHWDNDYSSRKIKTRMRHQACLVPSEGYVGTISPLDEAALHKDLSKARIIPLLNLLQILHLLQFHKLKLTSNYEE